MQRLEGLYGDRCRLDLRDAAGGGLEVLLAVPLRGAAAAGGDTR